jgi:hypothetical protein
VTGVQTCALPIYRLLPQGGFLNALDLLEEIVKSLSSDLDLLKRRGACLRGDFEEMITT